MSVIVPDLDGKNKLRFYEMMMSALYQTNKAEF